MAAPFYFSVWLICATLWPAYESFKAVKTKNTKNYVSIKLNNHRDLKVFFQVRWMMYWIVYAIFAAFESILDPILYFW